MPLDSIFPFINHDDDLVYINPKPPYKALELRFSSIEYRYRFIEISSWLSANGVDRLKVINFRYGRTQRLRVVCFVNISPQHADLE